VVVEVAAGRAVEVAAECRPQQAVRRPWAPEPQHAPRLAPQVVRAVRLVLARERAVQCVRERVLVARSREPARADQAETLPRVAAPLLAN
jgi:hypothetical protein